MKTQDIPKAFRTLLQKQDHLSTDHTTPAEVETKGYTISSNLLHRRCVYASRYVNRKAKYFALPMKAWVFSTHSFHEDSNAHTWIVKEYLYGMLSQRKHRQTMMKMLTIEIWVVHQIFNTLPLQLFPEVPFHCHCFHATKIVRLWVVKRQTSNKFSTRVCKKK